MRSRLLQTVALAVVCALHASVMGQRGVPALALLLAIAGTLLGPRVTLAQAGQALVVVGTAGLTFLGAVLEAPISHAQGGPKLQYAIFSGTALLTVASRLWLHNPERGRGATWVIGLLVFYCCGRVDSPLYLPLVTVYLGLGWLEMSWEGLRTLGTRHLAAGLALLVMSSALAAGTTSGLRRLYDDIDEFVIANATNSEVGFGAGAFRLGSMDGMRDNDEVILRVHGPASEHFRGQAYTDYLRGSWFPPDGEVSPAPAGPPPRGEVSLIEFVSEEQQRLFLPVESGAVEVTPRALVVGPLGVPRPAKGAPTHVRFDTTGDPRFQSPPPTPADLEVPEDIVEAVGPLVASWSQGATSPAERLARIQERLEQDYTYSLSYERDPVRDPVVQFLTDSRLGHCEYFASATAMAARLSGIPARVVTGFRSNELSPFGGHRIVRARDAHAWVEAWVDGGWLLVDPSPVSVAGGSFVSGAADDVRLAWERYGLQALVGVLVLVFVGLQVRTLLRNRRAPRQAIEEAWIEGPPDYLMQLLEVLAQADLQRLPSEPVEAFAVRTREAGDSEASGLLLRYAALRYGGVGDPGTLAKDIEAWLPNG